MTPSSGRERREYMRAVNLAKYGITPDDYDAMLENQGGRCAICGQPETALGYHGEIKSLAVDHCHDTGDVRGLLCQSCNMGIGLFDHNDELMQAAIKYLKA